MDDKNVWFWLEWLPLVCFVECNGINCGDDLYRSATYNEKESISQRYGAISMWRKNKMPVVSVFSLPLFCLVVLSSGLQWIRFQNKQSWPWYSAVHFLSLVFSCSWNLLVKPIYFVKNKMSTPKDNVLFLMFDGEKNTFCMVIRALERPCAHSSKVFYINIVFRSFLCIFRYRWCCMST